MSDLHEKMDSQSVVGNQETIGALAGDYSRRHVNFTGNAQTGDLQICVPRSPVSHRGGLTEPAPVGRVALPQKSSILSLPFGNQSLPFGNQLRVRPASWARLRVHSRDSVGLGVNPNQLRDPFPILDYARHNHNLVVIDSKAGRSPLAPPSARA